FERFSVDDWIKLVNINKAIVSELQLDKVLILILKNALSSIHAENGSLMLVDSDLSSNTMSIVASVGIPDKVIDNIKIKFGEGISGKVAKTGKSILIKDIEKHSEFKKKNNSDRYSTKSCISVPLIYKNKVFGVFNINNKKDNTDFTVKDLEFSTILAQQAAIAIQNAKLYSQVKKDKIKLEELNFELEESLLALSDYTEELFTFHEFTRDIFNSVLSYMDISMLSDELCSLFTRIERINADKVIISLKSLGILSSYDKNGKIIPDKQSKELFLRISDYCQVNEESIRIPFEEKRFELFEKDVFDKFSTLLCVPLAGKDGNLGSIIITRDKSNNTLFDEKTRNLMSIFSLQVSTAFSLVIALNEIMKKRMVENELKVAAKIQKMFMPKKSPLVPGLDIAHINIPTYDVGGDYIDFLWHNEDRFGIAVGDVSGKGVPAALIMALTKSIVKSNVSLIDNPKELLDKINYELLSEIEGSRFVTMVFGYYDWDSRVLSIGKAGHNPPLIIDKDKNVTSVNPQGLFLGMFRDCILREEKFTLNDDDVVVFYTDGITDAENLEGDQYGINRFIEFLKNHRDLKSSEIVKLLIEDVERFSENTDQKDDITMVVSKAVDFFDREILIPSRKSEINSLHNYIMKVISLKGFDSDEVKFKIRLIIDEIISNAVEHGNKLDNDKKIVIGHKVIDNKLFLNVEDNGNGFNWQESIKKEPENNIRSDRGRGIIILRELCESFKYNDVGNIAKLVISLSEDKKLV
ncbi:MAG: SpoIIE family protein phosphatase, partial [Candidatus Absconditabacterales bacterium]|nr:SpoIIE family protein phosphatase [Candidatus Absconditabacterales bacterium]